MPFDQTFPVDRHSFANTEAVRASGKLMVFVCSLNVIKVSALSVYAA